MHNLLSLKIENRDNLKEYPFKSKLYQTGFKIDFDDITIIVGENGAGKSTLLESLAYKVGFSTYGGNAGNGNFFNEINRVIEHNSKKSLTTLAEELELRPEKTIQLDSSILSEYMSLVWKIKSSKGMFIRAETFATLINLPRYSANHLSHGEGLIEIISNIADDGLYILDEPESGLSPNKIICLMSLILEKQKSYNTQFVISTHSPILMCIPNSKVLEISAESIQEIQPEDTSHYQLTKYILNNKEGFLKNLLQEE